MDDNFYSEGEVEYSFRAQRIIDKERARHKTNLIYQNIPFYTPSWWLRLLFFFIPQEKSVTTEGTVYFKKFRRTIYIQRIV